MFDPFMGVGTTAVAAVINGRRAAGAEHVRHYYDLAVERVTKALTGELSFRPDKPVYDPPKNSKLTTAPWESGSDKSTDRSGVAILPTKAMQKEMSSGIAYYEGELHNVLRHGRSNPPVPLVIIGVEPD